MFGHFPRLLMSSTLVLIFTSCTTMQTIDPPVAEKIEKELTIHGHTRIDNYYWLKERENPKVIQYLNEENDYLKSVMKHTEKFQENLYNEIVGRIKQTDESVPYFKNGYWYYLRFEEGMEYPIYCRKENENFEGRIFSRVPSSINEKRFALGFGFGLRK